MSETPRVSKAKWYSWFPENTSAADKKLILKTDFFLLSYSCMAFFLKYLDQTNISNAYVSGMLEELGFGHHNELSWFNTWFNIGLIIGSIPATLLAGYFRPRFYLPVMDLAWSLCVLFTFKAKTMNHVCVLRFFVGLFESSANPCTHYLLGCIYRKGELMRRSGFFVISGVIGQATSSYIQSGLYSDMNGVSGLRAWQWLFIFDFIIGIPVVIWGFIAIPELPHSQHKAWWLTEEESARHKELLELDGKVNHKLTFDVKQIPVVLKSWQLWVFSIGYALWTLTCCSYMLQFFILYLKSFGTYTVTQVNNIPTAISAVNLIFMIGTGIVSDKMGRRWPVCLFVGCCLIVATAMLLSSNKDRAFRMIAYTITGTYGCFTPILSGWCNIACASQPYVRAVTIPFMIVLGTVVSTPLQQNIFPSDDTPYYTQTHGYYFALAFSIVLTLWTAVVIPQAEIFFTKREQRKHTEEENVVVETASSDKKLSIE